MNLLGLRQIDEVENVYDYKKYVGAYHCETWEISIRFDSVQNKLFLPAFWPNIELKYLGNDVFKLDKFPLYLHYSDNGIVFYSDLVWDMKEKNFIKTDIKKLNKRFESN